VDGYVLHIKDNPLVESERAAEVAANVAPSVLNVSLRGVRVSMPGSPAMEAGDPITIVDRFGERYDFWATSVSWSTSGTLSLSCDVESSSPLVRTYRKDSYQSTTVNPIDIKGIITDVLDHPLPEMTPIKVFDDINDQIGGINTDIGNINTAIGGINTDIGGINGKIGDNYDLVSKGTIGNRLDNLENSTSVGQWIIKVNGVAQTTGTINFVT
jgi:hypothetical protein